KIDELSKRADAYGFRGLTIDGNNIEEVRKTTAEAIDQARRGGGPTLIEAETYRLKGHSRSDKELYRTDSEVKEQTKRDPITQYERYLTMNYPINACMISEIRKEVMQDVTDAAQFENDSQSPGLSTLCEGKYA